MYIVLDFKCVDCSNSEERFVDREKLDQQLCKCGGKMVKLPCAPRVDWLTLGQGSNPSPEALKRWERYHTQQKAKEEASLIEHGDYGPAPGAD